MDLIRVLTDTYLRIIVIDFLRYFIPASLAFLICWVWFKDKLKHRFIQKSRPATKKLWTEFRYSMSTVLIFALVGLGIVTAKQHGLTQVYLEVAEFGWFYLIFSLALMILFHDTYFYWTHRWMHHPKIYRHVHRVHHRSTNPSPWAAYSFHPWEAIVQAAVFPIMLFAIPVHPSVAFSFLIYMIVRNVWGHLGYELFPKSFMRLKWLNWHTTTTHHNLHHEKFNANYGLYFTWWDRWFKTEHKEYEERFKEVTHRKQSTFANHSKTLLTFAILSTLMTRAQSPAGKWLTFDESTGNPLSIVHIYQNTATTEWEGKVDSIILSPDQGTTPLCIDCPKPFKNKEVIGMQFLWGFDKSGEKWINGNILDPESGTIYKGKLWFTKKDEIQVRAYGGPLGVFYRTQTWQQLEGAGIEGLWQTIDDTYDRPKALVKLKIENGRLIGTIEQLFLLPHEGNYPICVACKNDLKNKPIVGMKIMQGFRNGDGEWGNGDILDPGNGTTYSARFWLLNDDSLKIRGYWGPLYRTQEWKRF
ncbi:MAG: DUF2147 domain-containing protein [Aurantibacter sp.]